ncbi:MAG TPA: YicC family protein [Aquifex aeolicus]|uniref:YicC family protein n=1 Tax=Aquifex aeolicus TaxID=63363 RepID=A0A9D1CG33_AQUAO|nr:YicC family protein [Aquifex aeolicus]
METVRSMTGFGRAYYRDENLKLVVLIKSVNAKGLEISVRLPKEVSVYEKDLRSLIKGRVHRGSVSVSVQLEFFKVKPSVKISDLAEIVDEIIASTRRIGLNISDDLTLQLAFKFYNPAVLEEKIAESDEFKQLFFSIVDKALSDFIQSKIEEGKNLLNDIEGQLEILEKLLKEVKGKSEILTNRAREKLLTKAREILSQDNSGVVTQELKLLLERLDINEEIQRLESHINLFREELKNGAPIGKKLEFITQEMLREVNTMGNKLPDLFPLNVEMKTAIDKIRQQVANLE